jgi:hypothetical protein
MVQMGSCAACSQLVDIIIDVSRRGADLSRLQALLDCCPSCGGQEWTPWGDGRHVRGGRYDHPTPES